MRQPEPTVRMRPPNDATNHTRNVANRASRVASIVGVASKFRHVDVVPGGVHGTFSNVRNVNTRLPTECNGFSVSSKYAAIPLAGPPNGVVSIVNLSTICKLPDGVVDGVQNHTLVMDLAWNPFNPSQLACALDTGCVNIWTIPDQCPHLATIQPSSVIIASHDKISSIRYNPVASDVLAISSHDHTVGIWNVLSGECFWQFSAHNNEAILAIAWSADGRRLVTVGRDLNVSVFQPQDQIMLCQQSVLESPRAARVLFACDDSIIVLVHFTRSSSRQVTLLDGATLEVLHTALIDTSSQPLIPHYDFDSSMLFLTGKGDRTITMFEVSRTSPFLLPLAPASFPLGHQAISLHNKAVCDVRSVEVQRGWRLTDKSLERISFRVPRVKKDLFQNDLFPRALSTWQPALNSDAWFAGSEERPVFVDLCPEGMHQLCAPSAPSKSEVPTPRERASASGSNSSLEENMLKKKLDPQEERKLVEMSWSDRIGVDLALEQDRMQGVAEEEWIDD